METRNSPVIDDTEQIKCHVENSLTHNGYTEYIVRVQRGPEPSNCWRVTHRYNDFVALHKCLREANVALPLPPKKFIGNMNREFIAERQIALQNYLNVILMNPILASSLSTKKFVDPNNYCIPFHETALQHASLALRGEMGWDLNGPLADIGWRLRKHYFQARAKSHPKSDILASWTEYGPDKYLDDKEIDMTLKNLAQLKHEHIHAVALYLSAETGALAVRDFKAHGSLRDLLCNAKPKQSFLKKYGNPCGHKPLTNAQIVLYGRQILDALLFLNERGIPYGHLHTGNIFIENDIVKLSDLENGVFGVPSFYRPYFVQHKKISTLEYVDVYCFGHILFEMIFGRPLHESVCEAYPTDCPGDLKSVLDSILSPDACKNGLPRITDLLAHACFKHVQTNVHTVNFKLNSTVRDKLKRVLLKTEERLRDEQKLVRSQKRIARVQEMMSSEEERRKRRSRLKLLQKEHSSKESKLSQQLTIDKSSPECCESAGCSTNTSLGTVTPPLHKGNGVAPMPGPVPPPPPLPQASVKLPTMDDTRSALLGSICGFNKNKLKPTNKTVI